MGGTLTLEWEERKELTGGRRGGRRKGGRGSATSTFLSEVSQICGASVAGLTSIKARFLNWYIVEEFNLSNCTGVRWRKGFNMSNCKSPPFFYCLTFEKADCSIFARLVGWMVGRCHH